VTVIGEAFGLPLLFLTVVLLGAIRPGGALTIVPPQPSALLTAMLLLAILVRSGALSPERLMNPARSALANLNGLTVLLALFAASAQVITLLVPDSGIPALIVWAVLLSLLVQTLAIDSDRTRVIRGLTVTFAAGFALKFIVLGAISAPAEGRVGRAVQTLFEGITLGTLIQRPAHPAEPYLAFGTLLLFLIGIAWLPSAPWRMVRVPASRRLVATPDRETDRMA
jgi:hypothetical protein